MTYSSKALTPSQHRQEQEQQQAIAASNSFESVARQWWNHWKHDKTERHAGYTIRRLEVDVFPTIGHKPADVLKPTKKTNYARLNQKELPELLQKIDQYDGQPLTKLALQLMALTFVRAGELIGARWEEIELDKKQ